MAGQPIPSNKLHTSVKGLKLVLPIPPLFGSHKWENACYKDVEAPQENAQDGINATPPLAPTGAQ